MKVLALGDPHGQLPKNIGSIIKKNKVELIICVGDFAFIPDKPWLKESWEGIGERFINRNYKEVVDKLASYKLPILTLRGNMFMGDKKKIADRILRKHRNLINKFTGKYFFEKQPFVFFDIIYEEHTVIGGSDTKKFTQGRIRKNERRSLKLNRLLRENKGAVLICHNPPYGVVDKAFNGKHVGSKILRDAIKKHQPKLVLCGHIHEAVGEGKIGKTKVINLGSHGSYKILDI